jgi:hypothetical protein
MNSRSASAAAIILLSFNASLCAASVSSGSIEPTAFRAQVCYSADCTTPIPGSINFRPTGTTSVTIDDVAGVDGVAWGNELGWISFDPTGVEQVTINPATGALSGKAWSQVSGWINFQPTGYGVSINGQGEFIGWAWAGGPYGGWIKFDCSAPASCVRTDWRPLSARSTPATPTTSGGNGPITEDGTSGGSPGDLCWNIDGIQLAVPDGYGQMGQTCTVIAPDVCQNLPGIQSVVPPPYVSDEGGLCRLIIDHCPNLPDIQVAVPPGFGLVSDGVCVPARTVQSIPVTRSPAIAIAPEETREPNSVDDGNALTPTMSNPPDDHCPNLYGVQSALPTGYRADAVGSCIPAATDYCPNVPGQQSELPSDLVIDDRGNCISTIVDADDIHATESGPIEPDAASQEKPAALNLGTVPLAASAAGLGGIGWLAFILFFRRWGRVFDVETGKSLAGARLLLYRDDGMLIAETTADAHGRFGFRVRPGPYQLRAVQPNYNLDTRSAAATYDGATIRVHWTGRASLDVAMRPTSQQR